MVCTGIDFRVIIRPVGLGSAMRINYLKACIDLHSFSRHSVTCRFSGFQVGSTIVFLALR